MGLSKEDREFFENKRIVEERKKRAEENRKTHSKKQLMTNIDKKFNTTMIGALAKFEQMFGHLWGHGKAKLTEKEQEYKDIWESTRTQILDNGNNQKRIALDEIAHYSVEFQKQVARFVVKQENINIQESKDE